MNKLSMNPENKIDYFKLRGGDLMCFLFSFLSW